MKVSQRQIDELHNIISIEVENIDYQEKVDEKLRDYRKKANIPGFRPGKVPMGIIRKQYEKPVLFDEINAMLSQEVSRYISDKELNIIGNPIPVPNDNIDWDSKEPMTFEFEIGIEPKIDIDLTKIKGITSVEITIDDKTLNEEVDTFARRYGSMEDREAAERDDFLQGKYVEADSKGKEIASGDRLEKEGSLPLRALTDKAAKTWVGKKAGDTGTINLDKDIKNGFNEASVTGFDQEQIDDSRHFIFTIEKVSQLVPAELNTELFDKVFGEGQVKTTEELRERLKQQLSAEFNNQTKQHFFNQVYNKLMENEVSMPETFLKKWLQNSGETALSEEEVNQQFGEIKTAIKWQFIRDYIMQEHNVVIDEKSMLDAMKQRLAAQFQLPGNAADMDEIMNGIAKQALEKEEERNRIFDDLVVGHLISIFEEKVNTKAKKMTWEDFVEEVSKK